MEDIREMFLKKTLEKEARKMTMRMQLRKTVPAPFASFLIWLINISGR